MHEIDYGRGPGAGAVPDPNKLAEELRELTKAQTADADPRVVAQEAADDRFVKEATKPQTTTVLISFRDGSYKKVRHIAWKHSQWIHFTLPDGSTVACNPANVNYLHIGCGE